MILGINSHYHARAFTEMDRAIAQMTDRLVVFNAHNFSAPENSIIYNTERLSRIYDWGKCYRNHQIWEMSKKQIHYFDNNYENFCVKHVPIGYHESMVCIERAKNLDIDVLFYGAMNERRKNVLHEIENMGCSVAISNYEERDSMISRAKLVLNVHYYGDHQTEILEIPRLAHLAANGIPILTEDSLDHHDYNWVPSGKNYKDLSKTAYSMVRQPELLEQLGVDTKIKFKQNIWVLPV